MPSSHLILCRPLLLLPPSLPASESFPMSQLFTWPKYWSFSFSISPSNEHPRVISFKMDWLDLLEVQGTLKSLLQYHSLKASILRCSAFFTVQLSHPYMTTGKTIALTAAAAAAKSLQLCSTLCNPIDSCPPGSAWDSPGKNTRVGCHFLLQCMKVKVESEKVDLKLNIQKMKIMASGPVTPWEVDGETVETVQMVTAAMKLKDVCSLEGKL